MKRFALNHLACLVACYRLALRTSSQHVATVLIVMSWELMDPHSASFRRT